MLGRAGAQGVFGDGFAGRPIRMQDKQFGKRVNNSIDDMYNNNAPRGPGGQQQQQSASAVNLPINQQQ